MPAMRNWPSPRDEQATASADPPPVSDRPSSRVAPAIAGWGRPPTGRTLTGRRRRPPFADRNAVLARLLGDPTDEARRLWLQRIEEWARADDAPAPPADRVVDRFAGLEHASVAVIGDPGAGRAAQQAVAPALMAVAGDTDLAVACGDIGVPAGGLRSYEERLRRPYADNPAPIYGVPGPADWHDGLAGFMTVFCGAPPDAGAPVPADEGPAWARLVRRLFWRRSPTATPEELAAARWYRDTDAQYAVQPGPYCAVDAGPLRLVLVDTGLSGRVDGAQARWLRAVSADDRPKILIAARPVFAGARLHRIPLDGGGDLNEIVTDPAYGYVAAFATGEHNYQRYPVRLRDGRTVQYVVAGAAGAPLSATHRIPNVDRLGPAVSEDDFRCYPLRSDSLARFSQLYDAKFAGGKGRLTLSSAEAATYLSDLLKLKPTRELPVPLSRRARFAAKLLQPAPAASGFHRFASEYFDWNDPPFFKQFLRVDVADDGLTVRCFGVTGCRDAVTEPPVEDSFSVRF